MINRLLKGMELTDIIIVVMFFLFAAALLLGTFTNRELTRSNNTYIKTMVCIASVNPTQRTPEYVKSCYQQAEAENGNTITHFGDGR